ncbi:WecB/TagA/CpsF family glycosyltransferase [Candidatus Berkelbacteria bacterium]|nr:WecB/TagA/CpsF family glycosyltransferase [Candidatus Berkelbacteria bacterium]
MKILGVKLDGFNLDQVLERVENAIAARIPNQIATINPEFILEAQKNKEFRQAINNAELKIADGFGLKLAAFFLRLPQPPIVTGTDLTDTLARVASKKGWRLYLLGGGELKTAQPAARALKHKYPDLKIVGAESGPMIKIGDIEPKKQDFLVKKIRARKPDILLVALGAPKQDLFIYKLKKELGVPIMMGVGGAFDFISGKVKRAPKLMRNLGIEWLWRLFAQPWRANRIFKATIIFPIKVVFSRFK